MALNQKVSLVSYRRNSSDMDLSSSEDESEISSKGVDCDKSVLLATEKDPGRNERNGDKDERFEGTKLLLKSEVSSDERLQDSDLKNREDKKEDRRDRRSPDRSKRHRKESERDSRGKRREDGDSRRGHHGRERSLTPEKKKRRSPERTRGRSPSHHHHRHRSRSRSPGRYKHSPDRREHRKRSHSPDRKSYKSRRSSRSPESFRSKRLERKFARIDRLGLDLVAEAKSGVAPFPDSTSKDGNSAVTDFFNPGASNHHRIAQQIQKRRLLWTSKKEPSGEQLAEPSSSAGTGKAWEAATFKGDNDGKMTEKFKRLMGIKADGGPAETPQPSGSLIQKQEEMFSNMEAQYQVARMATHTHRGIGLGFGTFQVPPR